MHQISQSYSYPVPLKDICKFERKNNISLNVCTIEEKKKKDRQSLSEDETDSGIFTYHFFIIVNYQFGVGKQYTRIFNAGIFTFLSYCE